MHKSSGPPLDQAAFEKLRRIAPNLLEAQRAGKRQGWQARPLPEEVAFKLTNRCNLRCTHCYQWNDNGYHHYLSPTVRHGDLPLSVIKKVLDATRQVRSNVYLWGGEPLAYRQWDGLIALLAEDPRWTSICTNGLLLEKRLASLLSISHHLEVSISLDGFESEHDAIRGQGSFAKTVHGCRLLVANKKSHGYQGEITVNCVIVDGMVGQLFDFVTWLEQEGIDTVYLSYPWYLSDVSMARMDQYYAAHFAWDHDHAKPSWHSYTFRLDPRLVDPLRDEIARIQAHVWDIKVRYNPALDEAELQDFISGSDTPAQNKTRCQSIRTRMDVFPNGDVVSCKFFPEFTVGNLSEHHVTDVWHGQRFNQVRETVYRCGLMPGCAKCNLLYTRGT